MKQLLLWVILITLASFTLQAETPKPFTLYGFVRTDFFYNSRMNEEIMDGLFHVHPKPIVMDAAGNDINAQPQAGLLSVGTRLGIDFASVELHGATMRSKIEFDFAGAGTTHFLVRLLQAYTEFHWSSTSLLVGQTWHPMSGSLIPKDISYNLGVPYQPFNRSPQLRLSHQLTPSWSVRGYALYQMQNMTNGPIGYSTIYNKTSLLPNLFAQAEYRRGNYIAGGGIDYKRIKPDAMYLSSWSTLLYAQYHQSKLMVKGKAVLGQNLSDHTMFGGYGKAQDASGTEFYTNMNSLTSWINVLYGSTWQVGILGGFSGLLGTDHPMHANAQGNFTYYGRGYYTADQILLRQSLRIAPTVFYNLPKLSVGIEYNLTQAIFGKIQSDGSTNDDYSVNNHRVHASVSYYL